MKLYYHPGACSLADHIALHEAGLPFEHVKVEFPSKKTEDGQDFTAINPKGYVPTLALDDGETLTENVAILDYIATQAPPLAPEGALGRTRLLEMLAYISSELHKNFAPYFKGADADGKKAAAATLDQRFRYLADNLRTDYLFGDHFSVADAYLFVMLSWAKKFGLAIPDPLPAYFDRVEARDSTRKAMAHEGLTTD